MNSPSEYWRNFWNEEARNAVSDFALNRRSNIRLARLEEKAVTQFLEAVSPRPEDSVLDAGCGSGRNICLLSPLVKEIVGIDYSDQMLARAREKIVAEKLGNVSLMPGDVTQLQFQSVTFNKVICASVLQYLDAESCTRAMQEMVRVCKPGGRIVLHIKNGCSLYGLSLKILRPVARLLGKKMKPEFYRSRQWHQRTLAKFGGAVVNSDGFGIMTFVPLPQQVVRGLLQLEMALPIPKFLKRFAVNCQMTVLVNKSAEGYAPALISADEFPVKDQ